MDEIDEELNLANTALTIQVARKHNAILSMQFHKIFSNNIRIE